MDRQVRNGQLVVTTCPECGCRLDYRENLNFFWHFTERIGYPIDAQGHRCSLVFTALRLIGKDFYHSTQTNSNYPDKWEPIDGA